MYWLRFVKQCHAISTEVGGYNRADVLGISEKHGTIEIEIKRSVEDLRRETQAYTKKHKHNAYERVRGWYIPNYYTFMVPQAICREAKEELDKSGLSQKYGLLAWNYGEDGAGTIESIKPMRRLHDGPPNERFIREIVARMSSELVNMRLNQMSFFLGQRQILKSEKAGTFFQGEGE